MNVQGFEVQNRSVNMIAIFTGFENMDNVFKSCFLRFPYPKL